ncbi:MAG TPA: pilus assembly protein N-terminal domain-containing protein [Vicinamibacterales bacterium]|nr:pilus assembly protein N-terminal domain-containing protein [Vicinamibacterales bacterium]
MSFFSRRERPLGWAGVGFVALAAITLSPSVSADQQTDPQATPQTQTVAPPQTPQPTVQGAIPDRAMADRIVLLAGRSLPLTTEFDVKGFSITDPEVADLIVKSPRELLLNGKKAGTISLIIWGDTQRVHHELAVVNAVTPLEQTLLALFPGEDIRVTYTEGSMILSGRVSSNAVHLRAAEVAQASAPKLTIINMLQLPGGGGSQQVLLQVRFAEVNRRAITELGVNPFTTRSTFTARSTTQQFPAPVFDDTNDSSRDQVQGLVFSDYLNLFFFQREQGIGAVIKALEQKGWFESLAEPNLIAYNGKKASFLAGGEFPVPIVSSNGSVNVTFKEFGVKLEFTPVIAGDVIRLAVRPEVSSLDFNNGVTISGFRIPALTSRWAQTEVELRDGQSFAIAGLLNNIGQEDRAAIPILSRLPIIGKIFTSKAARDDRTELMVLITPRLVRPLNPDEVPPLPTIIKKEGGKGDTSNNIKGGAGLIDGPNAPEPARIGRR